MKLAATVGVSLVAVVVGLGACQRHERACDTSVHELEDRALAARSAAGEPPLSASDRQQSDQAMAVMIERCTKDAWPVDTIGCIDSASTEPELAKCIARLSEQQRANLTRETVMLGDEPKQLTARIQVRKYAFEAFPGWAQGHPGIACPKALADLDMYMTSGDAGHDPWGHDLRVLCGATLPAGAKGIGIVSAGPDGQPGTADDISSWQ